MTRDHALTILREKLKNNNLFKHCLAVEACMKELSECFNEDVAKWALAGLLHDIDYEETDKQPEKHGIIGAQYLEALGLDQEIIHAIKVHAGHLAPESKLDWALFTVDPLTGLIVAAALMHPDKKLGSLDIDFLMRRFKEKRFAAGANRDQIRLCTHIDLELNDFMLLCLRGMQKIANQLGL